MRKTCIRDSIFITTKLNFRCQNKILWIFSANNNKLSIVMNKYSS